MNIGMLWFDNDPKTDFDRKVTRAVAYYRDKYGKVPSLCFVHPSMMPNSDGHGSESLDEKKDRMTNSGMEIRSNLSILPNHFWIGINGKSKSNPSGQ